jgi:hypothetical protein
MRLPGLNADERARLAAPGAGPAADDYEVAGRPLGLASCAGLAARIARRDG